MFKPFMNKIFNATGRGVQEFGFAILTGPSTPGNRWENFRELFNRFDLPLWFLGLAAFV